jgi:hypothetical protein
MFLWALIFSLHCSTSLQSGDVLKPAAFFSFSFGRPDPCAGRYVYMYDLPPRFNADLVRNCSSPSAPPNMCRHVLNGGFGPPITGGGEGSSLPETGSYDTDQYMLAMIFHARMRRHECLTPDPAAAAVVFVPFYAGFDLAMNQDNNNLSARDALSRDMVDWLERRPEWRAMGGRDHFLLVARPSWDFLRGPSGWGNAFMTYPAVRNMTVLTLEASPWHGNDFAVPYPSHFHPSSDAEVVGWQSRMRRLERPLLWCFAGASRPGDKRTVRSQIMEQCGKSNVQAVQAGGGRVRTICVSLVAAGAVRAGCRYDLPSERQQQQEKPRVRTTCFRSMKEKSPTQFALSRPMEINGLSSPRTKQHPTQPTNPSRISPPPSPLTLQDRQRGGARRPATTAARLACSPERVCLNPCARLRRTSQHA